MAPNIQSPSRLETAQQAIKLDSSEEAHTSLAFIYLFDLPGAEAEFQRAFALTKSRPGQHAYWYAHYLFTPDCIPEAETESRRALKLDPLNPMMNLLIG